MPNFLILSDIHANLEALQAVFAHAAQHHGRPDRIWCLGDIVGYGPDPGACIDLLRDGTAALPGVGVECIRGNHDEGVLQADSGIPFVQTFPQVLAGWKWTASVLTPTQKQFVANLPTSRVFTDLPQSVRLVHAAPPDDLDHYLLAAKDVEAALDTFEQRLCFFGHTHLACYFVCSVERREARPRLFPAAMDEPVVLQGEKLFLNPGAVGQPRWGRLVPWRPADLPTGYPLNYVGAPEARYLWVELQHDAVRVWCRSVAYNYEETIRKLNALAPALEVPERWKLRLSEGLR